MQAIAQKDPLVEYQRQGFQMFRVVEDTYRQIASRQIFLVQPAIVQTPQRRRQMREYRPELQMGASERPTQQTVRKSGGTPGPQQTLLVRQRQEVQTLPHARRQSLRQIPASRLTRAMLQIGEFEVYLFNDATAYMDPGGLFGLVPRVLWSRYHTADDRHLIRTATHNLLIRAAGLNIIVDTGFGNSLTDSQRRFLHIDEFDGTQRGLAALGVSAADIDIVINTHLHDDHCTGNFRTNEDNSRAPAFPNAEYLVQRREYHDATQLNERTRATYRAENYVPLHESGQMRLLDGDAEVLPGVTAIVTPGHTPGHMSLRIESRDQRAAFLCDMASLAVQIERLAWMTSFDVEPLVTLETKRRWQKWALENDALLIFPHDAIKPAGRLTQDEGGRLAVQPQKLEYDSP